jgi:outer membrane biosynthesis protein TonB
MKHPAGSVTPRRMRAPKTAPKKKVRLDLKRRPEPAPEEEVGTRKRSQFWKWVLLVALLHVLAITFFYFVYESAPSVKPPQEFISLLPEGDVVKGTPGAQEAHKVGPSTPAPSVHHTSTPPPAHTAQPPKPIAQKPPTPKPIPPKTELKMDAPSLEPVKPITPPKPVEPKPPKIKVDLSKLEDAPTTADTPKPKHVKKLEPKPDDSTTQDEADKTHATSGLSKEEIAAKLGDKLDAEGVKNAIKAGTSGSTNTRDSAFKAYYLMIAEQINEQWRIPNVASEMTSNPVVHIYVEKDGRVPPESVYLTQSSGNSIYDDSAVSTAKNFGYLREPLPDGCPPDISINFKPER